MGLILLAFSTLGAAPAQAQTVATDATLSEIVVNKKEGGAPGDEIALEPAFSSDRTSYSFVVGYESSSFLTVRTTHPRATVRILRGSAVASGDAAASGGGGEASTTEVTWCGLSGVGGGRSN